MLKVVKLKPEVTASKIHCDARHFDAHVKGKDLLVKQEFKTLCLLQDSTGEEYTVFKSHIDGNPQTTTNLSVKL